MKHTLIYTGLLASASLWSSWCQAQPPTAPGDPVESARATGKFIPTSRRVRVMRTSATGTTPPAPPVPGSSVAAATPVPADTATDPGTLPVNRKWDHHNHPRATQMVKPLGTDLHGAMQTQIGNGFSDRLALYHYDFYPADSPHAQQLTPRGRYELTKLGPMMARCGGQLKIQPTGNPNLDEARREQVIEQLAQLDIPVPGEAVVLGVPRSGPLYGDEAVLIYGRMFLDAGSAQAGSDDSTGGSPLMPFSLNQNQ